MSSLIYNQRSEGSREKLRHHISVFVFLSQTVSLIYRRAAVRQQTKPRLVLRVILGSLSWRPEQLREIRLFDIFMKFSLCSHRVGVGLRVNSSSPAAFFSGRFYENVKPDKFITKLGSG